METRRKQSDVVLAYMAGLIDSDGCIGITKSHPQKGNSKSPSYITRVTITNTSVVMMDWIVENFGGKYYARTMPVGKNWKQCYNWLVAYSSAGEFLELIESFLVVKRPQALLCLELLGNWVTNKHGTPPEELARRERLYRAVRELNATGLVQRERLNSEAPPIEGEAIV